MAGKRRIPRIVRFGAVLALVLAVALAVVRETYGWVFPVTSGSMEPTLSPGDWVFVRYDRSPPERHEIVVIAESGGGASVKRVAGEPGETIRVDAAGDVRVGASGALPPDSPRRPAAIPLFDSDLQSLGEYWAHGAGDDASMAFDPWERLTAAGPGEEWRLDGGAVPRGSGLGLLRFRGSTDDGWLRADGTVAPGVMTAHDLEVSFDLLVEDAGGYLQVELTEQGDVFLAVVRVFAERERCEVYIGRREALGGLSLDGFDLIATGEVALPTGSWLRVRFANSDNRLRFEVGGEAVAAVFEGRNAPHPLSPDGRPFSLGERVRLGAAGLDIRVRDVVVARDLVVLPVGRYAVDRALALDPDEFFVVGDASSVSRDSRERGPIPTDRLVGRVEWILWPPSRIRDL